MSYEAIVSKITVRPHPNADRLQIGVCQGHQVVVGLDTQDGEIGVFFPCDGQLSEEFVVENALYSKAALDKLGVPYEEDRKFGFFSEKRRVRAQGFRGVKSDGFWCPKSYLDYAGLARWVEGDTFTAQNGHEICQKYETKATRAARARQAKVKKVNPYFVKHDVTKQFKYVNRNIPTDGVFYITEKLHGTSGRYGLVLDDVELPWWKRVVNGVKKVFPEREYRYLNGSKNVILEKTTGEGWYGTNDFRLQVVEGITLHKGEILYFEIVGYVENKQGEVRAIMDPHVIKDEVKSLRKAYGEIMVYDYGVPYGECKMYVYKITRTNEDGVVTELSWPQVQARCDELGLETVPLLDSFKMVSKTDDRDTQQLLEEMVAVHTEGPSTLDSGHMREGCVLRVESRYGVDYIKNKSWNFGVLEGYIKDSEDYVDTEEAS